MQTDVYNSLLNKHLERRGINPPGQDHVMRSPCCNSHKPSDSVAADHIARYGEATQA